MIIMKFLYGRIWENNFLNVFEKLSEYFITNKLQKFEVKDT
jgi:hypothetical protein